LQFNRYSGSTTTKIKHFFNSLRHNGNFSNELRLKRKHRGGDDNGRNKGGDRRINVKRAREDERKKDKKTIKSLTRTIAALSCKTDDPE
jgi:hypothetical protein